MDGELFVGSYGDSFKFWERNVRKNPKAVLGIQDSLYRVELEILDDAQLEHRVNKIYHQKYDMTEVFGEVVPVWWFYQVSSSAKR